MCDICGCNDNKVLFSNYVKNIRYVYGICKNCSYVHQLKKYPRFHYENLPCQGQEDYEEHTKRRANYILDFIDDYLPGVANLKILDVGCGQGGVMKHLKASLIRSQVYGYTLDNGKPSIDSNLNIIYRNVETGAGEFDSNLYDVIIMSHVAEHFYNPVSTMRKFKDLLKPHGIIYVEVPSFINGEVRVPNIFTPEHISFFTSDTMTNLLEISDYKILKMVDSKYWGNIKVVASRGNFKSHPPDFVSSDITLLKRFVAKLMYPLYRGIKRLIRIEPND